LIGFQLGLPSDGQTDQTSEQAAAVLQHYYGFFVAALGDAEEEGPQSTKQELAQTSSVDVSYGSVN
jgi:hypothetical protein